VKKEYGPSDFAKMISGLAQEARQVEREEFDRIVNPDKPLPKPKRKRKKR
jgi:hypothetical protein